MFLIQHTNYRVEQLVSSVWYQVGFFKSKIDALNYRPLTAHKTRIVEIDCIERVLMP